MYIYIYTNTYSKSAKVKQCSTFSNHDIASPMNFNKRGNDELRIILSSKKTRTTYTYIYIYHMNIRCSGGSSLPSPPAKQF